MEERRSRNDFHHILFEARHWNAGEWAKRLREHPYLLYSIPRKSMHMRIHEYLGDIAVPSEEMCQKALVELNLGLSSGLLDWDDGLEERIAFMVRVFEDKDETTAWLMRYQLRIVRSFAAEARGEELGAEA